MRDRGKLSQTVIVDKWFASTGSCPECGRENKFTLKDRRYTCGCRYSEDRERKAAHILQEGLNILAGKAETALISSRACSVSLSLVCETRSPSLKAVGSSTSRFSKTCFLCRQ
ncbi:MAG: transposase [Spirochaetaceae bacterium]|nr:transposase [Spirochaetaceae bacterium]